MTISLKTKIPGPKSIALMARRQVAVARGPFHTTPVFVAKANGVWVEDVDGNLLLDFASGIGVTSVGHTPARVVNAIRNQAGQLIHSSFNVMPYEGYVALSEKLNAAAPGDFKKKTFLANSGAEAVENAVKIARTFTGRQPVVCFEHAFHGRTYMAMSLTYKDKPYKHGFGPFNSEVYRAPFPYAYRWPTPGDLDHVSQECFRLFEEVVNTKMGTKPAAVIIEPVLGEGGFVPAPKKFLNLLRQYCSVHGVVLIADEIQTGFGRTGTLFACEQLDIIPDLVLSAKALGAGMPVSAVTGRADIMDSPSEGGIGGTFGGNPISCAAALAVFEVLEQDAVLDQARKLGLILNEKFKKWTEKFPVIGDARGLGPMRALELVKDRKSKEAFPEAAKGLVRYCYERGLVIMTAGSQGNVIRLLMPLIIKPDELEEGLQIIEDGLREIKL